MTREPRSGSDESSGEEHRDDPRDSEDERGESSETSNGEERRGESGASASEGRTGETREHRDDPRDSEGERGEPSETSNGEEQRDDPRDSEGETGADHDEPADAMDVPLNIAGHEEEKRRREEGSDDDDGPETDVSTGESPGADVASGDGADPAGDDQGEAGTAGDRQADPDDPVVLSAFDVSESDVDDDEVEPVELLVQLAKDGEIEPWDIDIVVVTDKFLDRLDGADLRAGGRALFYASVLLRMKSDAMLDDEGEYEEEARDGPLDDPLAAGAVVDPFDALEKEIDRRLDRKHARGSPQTLDELVRDLRERERETMWKESRTYDTSGSPHGYARGTRTLDYHADDDLRLDDEPTEADAFGRLHDEHMEDVISDVYVALREHYDQGRDEVLYEEIASAGGDRVNTFLGLLFLSHRGQVRLQQDELFGDLWVQDPAAVAEVGEALADGGSPE